VRATTVSGCTMSCIGFVLFAISNTGMNLLYPAFILVSLGGPSVYLATQTVSNLFENKAMVISSLVWSFQLTPVWLMLCNVLNEYGISASLLYICYAVVAGLLTLQCWSIYPKKFETMKSLERVHSRSRESILISTERYNADFLTKGTFWQMLFSVDYIFLVLWYSFYQLYLLFYIMTVGTQTELATGENMASQFTIILSTVSASAILSGYAIDVFGFGVVVLCNSVFSIGASFCINSSESGIQWIGFILYVLSRVTTYSAFFFLHCYQLRLQKLWYPRCSGALHRRLYLFVHISFP